MPMTESGKMSQEAVAKTPVVAQRRAYTLFESHARRQFDDPMYCVSLVTQLPGEL